MEVSQFLIPDEVEPSMDGLFQQRVGLSRSDFNSNLNNLLAERKVDMIYNKEKMSQAWLPFNEIEDILGSKQGQASLRALSVDVNRLRAFVSRAKRLWALLVHVNRLIWLESFCNANFGDSLFPIRRGEDWDFQSCSSKMTVSIPGIPGDDEVAFDAIEDQQWQFFVPIFGKKNPTYEFDYRCRMPFIREFQAKETNVSAVRDFVIHRKHLDFRSDNQIVRENPVTNCGEIDVNALLRWRGPLLMRMEILTSL